MIIYEKMENYKQYVNKKKLFSLYIFNIESNNCFWIGSDHNGTRISLYI